MLRGRSVLCSCSVSSFLVNDFHLIQVIAIQKKNIREQQKKLSSIKDTIQVLSSEISSGTADSDDAEDENLDDDSEKGSLSDPIWDQIDDVFRCTVCSWEVIDGFCHACMMEFKWDVVRDVLSCLVSSDIHNRKLTRSID